MLKIDSLSKSFGSKTALSDVSLTAEDGRITALVGANGAGKSTLIGVVCGYFRATSGVVTKGDFSVMPDAESLYREMSGKQFLSFIAGVKHASDSSQYWHQLAVRLGIADQLSKKIKSYSFGMKKKIAFIQACIGNYDTYLFDEPTSGVDVQSSLVMLTIIEELKDRGAAVLLTSHNMDELQRISDYVYYIDHGRITSSGTVSDLIAEADARDEDVRYIIEVDSDYRRAMMDYLAQAPEAAGLRAEECDRGVMIRAHEEFPVTALLKGMLNSGLPVTGFWRQKATLEKALFGSDTASAGQVDNPAR
ncbi:ABC transporter ATP-binding protein [uncultured Bifidobacterium sp.]|uniref:ABC transporter ATP-binding protein n=1 Tax=uncultured Bifidobacterium sp. TaxID=165187 RepID=UPI00260421AC|nr:ABC transporter ATP-binding protein [uncultured Bifidobacterium sp.]